MKAILKPSLVANIIFLQTTMVVAQPNNDIDTHAEFKAARAESHVVGARLFNERCAICHGRTGEEKIKFPFSMHLNENSKLANEIQHMVGNLVGDLHWGALIEKKNITDFTNYISSIKNPIRRGEAVFKNNCIQCHGVRGNGKGRASILLHPPPADLTHSDKNVDYKRMIITLGGAAMGRSQSMPVWGEQLTPDEINDVLIYIQTLLIK